MSPLSISDKSSTLSFTPPQSLNLTLNYVSFGNRQAYLRSHFKVDFKLYDTTFILQKKIFFVSYMMGIWLLKSLKSH